MQSIEVFKNVFRTEISCLEKILAEIDSSVTNAVDLILNCDKRVIVIGMGKSGIIGKKIAATFASTGTSSFFVHPAEAFHGDLGMILPGDLILMISYSGETEELIRLIPFFEWQKNKIISITGKSGSTLAKHSDVVLNIFVEKEACTNNLAPTSSTTATLVMGDALAVTVSTLKQFKDVDFARFHPGGSLGKMLLTRVKDVMSKNSLPICSSKTPFLEVVKTMTQGRKGLALVIDSGDFLGIITDGDLRRSLDKSSSPLELFARDMMSKNPQTISEDENFSVAQELMIDKKISSLVVVNANKNPIGLVQIHDVKI